MSYSSYSPVGITRNAGTFFKRVFTNFSEIFIVSMENVPGPLENHV